MSRASLKAWLGNWQEWGSIIFLFIVLEIAVRSIEQAQWITPQPSLTSVLALAVLTGWILCKSRLPGRATYPLAMVLGAIVTVWQAANLLPSLEMVSKVNQLIIASQSWWQTTSAASPSQGTIHFAVFLTFFTWILGYVSTWFILRRQNAWVAVSLGAITILVNLGNLPERHYVFFFFYALAALLLVGQTSLVRQHYWFKKHNITYLKRGIVYFMASLLCFSTLAVSVAWLTPEIRVNRLETLISTKTPLRKNIEEHITNFFAAVRAKQPFLKSREQRELFFGDSFGQGNELQFVIISKQPHYWRTRMYDIYTSSGWISSKATEQALRRETPSPEAQNLSQRSQINYIVIPKLRTDIVLTAGEFVSSNIPSSVQLLAPLSFDINLQDPADDPSLPPDVASLASSLRAIQAANKAISPQALGQLLPEDLRLTGIGATGDRSAEADFTLEPISDSAQLNTIEVTRTQIGESNTIAVTSPLLLKPDQGYTVTASISSATTSELANAGGDYPHWVTDYYLQLPPTLPERVRRLSETVTEEAKSPYDKALAIRQYLSQFAYTLEVKATPQEADGVDYFLFTKKSGNCVQFASSMVVMLRSVGVPSRFSTGYSPSGWDTTKRISILRAEQRHTWAEVYFPEYGWVEFEATPAIASSIEAIPAVENDIIEDTEEWEELMNMALLDEPGGGGGAGTTFGNRLAPTLAFAFIGIILLLFVLRSVSSRWLRRFRQPDLASEVYGKMCSLASLARLSPRPQQTPLEYYATLASVFPVQAEALDSIVQAYVKRRFSDRKELEPLHKGKLQKSWVEVYPVLLKRLFHIRY